MRAGASFLTQPRIRPTSLALSLHAAAVALRGLGIREPFCGFTAAVLR